MEDYVDDVWTKYCRVHLVDTRGRCDMLKWGSCVCPLTKEQHDSAYVPDSVVALRMKVAQVQKATVEEAPLPVEVEDRFKGYESLYELTLTTDKDDPYELREWLTKISQSSMYMAIGYIACVELTKAGIPHIHALIFSKSRYCDGSKIKKSLKYPYRYEMKRVKRPANYYTYINKEKDSPLVIDYCVKKGIDQIWENLFK